MSANNILIIEETKNGYSVFDKDIEADFVNFPLKKCKSLREAIKYANRYMKNNIVEYGLRIKLKERSQSERI